MFAQHLALTTEAHLGQLQGCPVSGHKNEFPPQQREGGQVLRGQAQALPILVLVPVGSGDQGENWLLWIEALEDGGAGPGQPGKMKLFVSMRPRARALTHSGVLGL